LEPRSQTRVEMLDRDECLQLLSYKSYVGRVAFVVDGQPMVLPVNYLAEEGSIVFCTAAGTKLNALSGGARVSFEVDDSRPLYHAGWSVLVIGTAREITDEGELDGLRRGPLRSWATPASEHWIRISIDEISGRRIPEY
jgi:nitroimidazol reductase NimA-like FMN-containing flavoprotein (pyridoxamine 5'-phosphate oxidase superfamily)